MIIEFSEINNHLVSQLPRICWASVGDQNFTKNYKLLEHFIMMNVDGWKAFSKKLVLDKEYSLPEDHCLLS